MATEVARVHTWDVGRRRWDQVLLGVNFDIVCALVWEIVTCVWQVAERVVDWAAGFLYNRARLYARVQGNVSTG